MGVVDEFRDYRQQRKQIRWLLSDDNRNFW